MAVMLQNVYFTSFHFIFCYLKGVYLLMMSIEKYLYFDMQNVDLVKKGICNLRKQIENASFFRVPVVVAINKYQ